jgi:hypothetical protein
MQTPCSDVLKAVETRLKSISIPGIKREEIQILPEGRPPAIAGEKYLVISPTAVVTNNPERNLRSKTVGFRLNLIQRTRATPEDRLGLIYEADAETHEIHEVITSAVESLDMFRVLITLIKQTETNIKQVRYSISKTFTHRVTVLSPVHLYPGYFHGKSSEHDSKLAGYRTFSTFTSPSFTPSINPLSCAGE